jgi:hypothetical protein
MDILLGILLVLFGVGIACFGIQVFMATLPMLGFLLGFFIGTAGVEAIWGDSFLSSVTSWLVGFGLGLVFALVSYFWWYAGALLAAGAWGAALGTGLVRAFGGSSDWLLFLFGAIGFVAIMLVALSLNLPVYIIIVNTAFAGATVAVAGVLLVFGQIDYQNLGRGTMVSIINESWWWVLVTAGIAAFGMLFQMAMRSAARLPQEKWVPANSAA